MNNRGELLEPILVLPTVVATEQQLTARGKDSPDGCLRAAAIAAVGGGQSMWRGHDSGHCVLPTIEQIAVAFCSLLSIRCSPSHGWASGEIPLLLLQIAVEMPTDLSGN